MKYKVSTPALAIILVIFAGVLFPVIFSMTDRLLRTALSDMNPTLLTAASFTWLLFFYFYGIKFSIEYIIRQFEISENQKLFRYSNIGFTAMSMLFYASLISPSWFSNIVWGSFYFITIGLFYWLSSKALLSSSQ